MEDIPACLILHPSPGTRKVIHHCHGLGQLGKLFGSWEISRPPANIWLGLTAGAICVIAFGRIQFGSGVPWGEMEW